jgi:dTDP-4-amino-4,6-dideoxygalactose transaminase
LKNLIPFNKPNTVGTELTNIEEAYLGFGLSGNGPFTKECHKLIKNITNSAASFLTHSCTSALEMASLLYDFKPGDEVIMPSYTFVSTANAFVLRGCKPVFIDIEPQYLNINVDLIADAITPNTVAIVPVHYAGISCDLDKIAEIANKYKLIIIEDAAQAFMSKYKDRSLGSIGNLGAYSFHETKNIISGEGGALNINDSSLIERAEIIWEKGTDRSKFFRGQVDKYTWQSTGSSFLPGELIAAFLKAQLDEAWNITNERLRLWNFYKENLKNLEIDGYIDLPAIPEYNQHNAHMFQITLKDKRFKRDDLLEFLKKNNIHATFHYIPLHSSPAGLIYGTSVGDMCVTNFVSENLIRLPLWIGLLEEQQEYIIDMITKFFK